ncbi:uncharacterized protein LOC119541758 [Choloepus didactylus]|uniref:uncharacterized protein LOC119541758 n=1 Tax=Choloepus didactylus TaxID=27675 RepID=UPI00189F257E|nr:uncharacterized protein LOC119541758 [Choloepus didactylus]
MTGLDSRADNAAQCWGCFLCFCPSAGLHRALLPVVSHRHGNLRPGPQHLHLPRWSLGASPAQTCCVVPGFCDSRSRFCPVHLSALAGAALGVLSEEAPSISCFVWAPRSSAPIQGPGPKPLLSPPPDPHQRLDTPKAIASMFPRALLTPAPACLPHLPALSVCLIVCLSVSSSVCLRDSRRKRLGRALLDTCPVHCSPPAGKSPTLSRSGPWRV